MPSSCVSDGRWRELIKEACRGHQAANVPDCHALLLSPTVRQDPIGPPSADKHVGPRPAGQPTADMSLSVVQEPISGLVGAWTADRVLSHPLHPAVISPYFLTVTFSQMHFSKIGFVITLSDKY